MPAPEKLKFYAKRLGYPHSENMGKILSFIFDTPEKQDLAACLPGSIKNLAQQTGMPLEMVDKTIQELRRTGAVCKNQRDTREKEFLLYPGIIEFRDAVLLTPGIDIKMVEMMDYAIREEMPEIIVPIMIKTKTPPVMRTIPIEETIDSQSQVLDIDSARNLVEIADQIVAVPCVCRSSRHSLNKSPDCPAPKDLNLCLLLNRFGNEALDRGIGTLISKEEAVNRLKAAEEAGLVHMTRNNVKKDMSLCNCCSCCCTGLFLVNQVNYAAFAPSRFRVKLQEEACVGCGTCEDRCQFNAIQVDDVALIDPDKCFGCGNCVPTCPGDALILEEIRPKEFIRVT
jgi:NAD-dependent dihydropyrimidine dehydrogenase PreA subunit